MGNYTIVSGPSKSKLMRALLDCATQKRLVTFYARNGESGTQLEFSCAVTGVRRTDETGLRWEIMGWMDKNPTGPQRMYKVFWDFAKDTGSIETRD